MLYRFSRRLAGFRLQTVLDGLPVRFLTQKPCRKTISGLPEKTEKRLALFLEHYGVPEQTLAFYLALYPEMTGSGLSDLLMQTALELPDFSRSINEEDRKRATDLLKLFYVLRLNLKKSQQPVERFEQLLNGDSDFRLEAAFLERINDFFYEDDNILTAAPDWFATTRNDLSLSLPSGQRPFQETPDRQKTAKLLLYALFSLFFRDGLLILPAPAGLRSDDEGRLLFIRARIPVVLTDRERMFAVSFTDALITKNKPKAAKALSLSGYTAGSEAELTRFLENFEQETESLSLSGKAQMFLKSLSDPPLFFRYGVFVLKMTEALCRPAFTTGEEFEKTVCAEIAAALPEERKPTPSVQETAILFRQTFSLLEHHLEQLALRNKKPPAFLTDSARMSEILSRQTVLKQFGKKHFRFRPFFLPLAIIGIISVLLLF